MTPAARHSAAIELIDTIDTQRVPAAKALKEWGTAHRYAGSGDRAAISGLVWDVLRRQASSAYLMNDDSPRARVLGMLKLERGMDVEAIAALCDGGRFAPVPLSDAERAALTSRSVADAPAHIAGDYPEWLDPHLAKVFAEDRVAEATAMASRAPLDLRVNTLKGTRQQLIERLATEGVVSTPARWSPDLVWVEGHHSPGALAAFKEGWCTVQDESEALVCRLVAPVTHERLLDLCAAPGGKCTHLAELMGDEGEVWAMERAEPRVASLEATVARLGTHAVHVVQGDGRTYDFPMPFDRVLVDAPCSGLGVLGRRADARWRKGPEMLAEMPPLQLELLAAGGHRARPGGILVYSVCSFEPEETDGVVERFLKQHPQFVLESAKGLLPDEVVEESGCMRVLPHVHGCDGAFAARFRKK